MNAKSAYRNATLQEQEMWQLLSGQTLQAAPCRPKRDVSSYTAYQTNDMLTLEMMMRPA